MRYNNAYSLADALALEVWDIITFQGTSRDVISEVGIKNMVASFFSYVVSMVRQTTRKQNSGRND